MIELAAIGLLAGVLSGLLGVGGGILFVPGLVFVAGLTQVDAEATSLLAIIPVALLGAWRQHRYGNMRLHDGVLIGVLSLAGAIGGVVLANVLPAGVLRMLFALLMLGAAYQLVRSPRASVESGAGATARSPESGASATAGSSESGAGATARSAESGASGTAGSSESG